MYDELAVKLFAAEQGIESEADAKATMYQYGFADKYVKLAELLQPVFQEAYEDGIEDGAKFIGHLLDTTLHADDNAHPSVATTLEGVRVYVNDAIAAIQETHAEQAQEQPQDDGIMDEATIAGLLGAILGGKARVVGVAPKG